MSEENQPGKRRTLSTFRSHLLLTSLTATAAFSGIIAVSIFVPLAAHLGRAPVNFEIAPGLAEHFLFMHSALWPLVFLSLCACVVTAMILFHRMRSPLRRYVQCFEQIRSGSIPEPIVIRVSDYLHEETDSLNDMIAKLSRDAESRRRNAERFEEILAELSAKDVDPFLVEQLTDLVKFAFRSHDRSETHDSTDA